MQVTITPHKYQQIYFLLTSNLVKLEISCTVILPPSPTASVLCHMLYVEPKVARPNSNSSLIRNRPFKVFSLLPPGKKNFHDE